MQVGHRAPAIESVAHALQPSAEMFRTPVSAFDPEMAASYLPGKPAASVSAILRRFHDSGVAPYRQAVSNFLEADRASRGNIMLGHGVDGFLRSLHPLISWEPPVLEVSNGSDRTVLIDDRGLLFSPSLFYFDRPDVFAPHNDEASPPVLVYTPPITVEAANRLWNRDEHKERALAALVGRTRSKLLGALSGSSTTTELGRRLGVSAASVSQHTGVLREAGLITTHRRQNTVRHSLTPLGVALVNRLETAGRPGATNAGPATTPTTQPQNDLVKAS
ncbi:ArsR/SmtB family transcription factor [Plantactinospora endophytica]|uniref:HTH arsR-type domain-containing protein n=1 Tax=Plantactinospora endophytica TaxID=673535 RepID=A0ABQ4E6J6_9ACTN|nr:winged helix-turn-helix domain-containing protein [Plantactinospora endophytica]GIG90345.1 hypothetical protein Pen02_52810 [Plantactinospora endophytica]